MSTPDTAAQANANSIAAMTELQTAANNEFIAQAAQAIANAEALGIYYVVLTTFKNCNIINLQNYFQGLGYLVSYPYSLIANSPQPVQTYEDYGANAVQYPLINPTKIRLDWNLPQS
jgi:hypothetical protein